MTIVVSDSYTVHSAQSLVFTDEMGFDMQWSGDGPPPSLTIAGSVQVSGDDASGFLRGVGASDGSSPMEIWNKSSGVLTVTATGESVAMGVSFENDGSLRNDGQISASSSTVAAYAVDGYALDVQVVNTGVIEASAATVAEGVLFHYGGAFANSGSVTALADTAIGVDFNEGDFSNDGHIEARGGASASGVILFGNGFTFDNAGLITAHVADADAASVALELYTTPPYGFVAEIFNSGTIKGDYSVREELYSGDGAPQILVNNGVLIGTVDLGGLNDIIDNSGKIRGDVLLGSGDDSYVARGSGKAFGEISGGAGHDHLVGGKGADHLSGDAGADTLDGGAGADILTGGGGGDTFVFSSLKAVAGAHHDLIVDLGATDTIDLSGIDADLTRAGDQAFTLVDHFDGHAGQALLAGGDAGSTSLLLDVDGDGDGDAVIDITGDHLDFANFVL